MHFPIYAVLLFSPEGGRIRLESPITNQHRDLQKVWAELEATLPGKGETGLNKDSFEGLSWRSLLAKLPLTHNDRYL